MASLMPEVPVLILPIGAIYSQQPTSAAKLKLSEEERNEDKNNCK